MVASEIVLIGGGDWTEVYINGKDYIGGHSLSDYDWALVIREAQPIESINQREFVVDKAGESWGEKNEFPQELKDIPEAELTANHYLMEPQGLTLPAEVG